MPLQPRRKPASTLAAHTSPCRPAPAALLAVTDPSCFLARAALQG